MRTYNLFCRKGHAALVCAIPEDWPVPAFIMAELWVYGGKLETSDVDPSAFNHETADASVRLIGFYLFQVTKALDGSPSKQGGSAKVELEEPVFRTAPRRETTQTLDHWRPARARANDGRAERMRVAVGLSCGM